MGIDELQQDTGWKARHVVTPVEQSAVAFWKAMLYVTFGVFVGESVAVVAYVLSTPDGAHRFALGVIAVVSVLIGLVTVVIVPWIAHQSWRSRFSLAWTVLASLALTVASWLDGGLQSPLLFLILLPMAYAGWMFRPAVTAGYAAISVGELVTITVTDSTTSTHSGQLVMLASATAGLGVLSWLSSVYRARLDHRVAELTRDLVVLAATDHLTGCLNRRAFSDRLDEEIDRAMRHCEPLSLVVADIDGFKYVNDTYGHPAGDEALKRAATTLRDRSRRSDIVARIGGDEFALLLPGVPLDAAVRYAQRVFDQYSTGMGCLTFSAGVATLERSDPTAERLFLEADRMMYHVKRGGGGGIAVSTPSGEPMRCATTSSDGLAVFSRL